MTPDLRILAERLSREMEGRLGNGPYEIGAPGASKLHAVWAPKPTGDAVEARARNAPVFLVQADWHKACAAIEGYEGGEFRLPFPNVSFEMQINGVRFFALFEDTPDEEPAISCSVLFEEPGGAILTYALYYYVDGKWRCSSTFHAGLQALIDTIAGQAKAVSILLEAGTLTTQVWSPPEKLNRARLKRGKAPLRSFHILKLRARSSGGGEASEYKGVVRLHFRRGHWMHRNGRRIWRKWALVGNPELGFVDKQYQMGEIG